MSAWPQVALGKILEPVAERIVLDPDTTYSQVTARLWGKGLALRETVRGAEIAAAQQNRVRPGQFLIPKIDARHGAFGIVPPELDGAVVSNDFPVFAVDQTKALPDFVLWVSRTDWFVALCRHASEGSTNRVRLKEARFLAASIPLPPLDEQRRIVERLDGAAARVDRVRELQTEIRDDLAALVVRANCAYQERTYRLDEVLALREDRVPLEPGNSYPQVGIKGFGGGLFKKGSVATEETTYRHFNRLSAGQFVVSQVKGWGGAIAVCDGEHANLFASPEYRTFECLPDVLQPRYFSYLVQTPWFHGQIAPLTRGQGARRERLRPEMLLGLSIPLPSLADQATLVSMFDRMRAAITAQAEAAAHLDHFLPAMLHEAFGE